MAEIKPLRAFRYAKSVSEIHNLVTPYFDNIDNENLDGLYKIPFHSINLIRPKEALATVIENWKTNKVIKQDPIPGIYVYYQQYKLQGDDTLYCRKGFICNIKISDWEEKIILRHEETLQKSLQKRSLILQQSLMNTSPLHGLYTDESLELEKFMDESIQFPIYQITDNKGVKNILAVIHDAAVISSFIKVLKSKQIILADGHHRYEAALNVKKINTTEAAQYVCMYLSNTENNDISSLATHRLIKGTNNINADLLLKEIEIYYKILQIPSSDKIVELITEKEHAFGLLTNNGNYIIELKENVLQQHTSKSSLQILHELIIDKLVGKNNYLAFTSDLKKCVEEVKTQNSKLAFISNSISIESIKEVCYKGFTFPPKSTYFYPKVLTGFIFNSLAEKDQLVKDSSCFNF